MPTCVAVGCQNRTSKNIPGVTFHRKHKVALVDIFVYSPLRLVMAPCVAFGCSNRSCKKVPGITFHNFPVNQERKTAWIKAVRRENWFPTKSSKLCSEHFAEEDIDRTSVSSVRIRENAVPSIFKAFPSYLQKVPKKRKAPTTDRNASAPPAKIHYEELEEQNVEKSTKKVVQSKIGNKNCECISSKSIDVPDLLNILPSEYSYALCDLERMPNSENFQCRFRVNISTKETAIEWLQQFTVSNVNYKYRTCSEDTQNHIYKVELKCDHNIRTDKNNQHTKGNLKCPSKLTLIVKRTSLVDINTDIHLEEFPTEVMLYHLHNHPTNCEKKLKKRTPNVDTLKTFIKLLKSGCTPSSEALGYINELQNTDHDEYILGPDYDCSMVETKIEDTDREVSQCESYSSLSPEVAEGEIEREPDLLVLEKFQTELENINAKVKENPLLLPAAKKFVEQSQKINTLDALASALSAFGR